MGTFKERLRHAFNAFVADEQANPLNTGAGFGVSYGSNPDRPRRRFSNERTIISSVYTRLGNDAASVDIRQVRLDDTGRYLEDLSSGLQDCLTVAANIDQAARAFRLDIFLTMFDEGHVAIVPVDATINPSESGAFDVKTMRVGKVVEWAREHVKVDLFNEKTQRREQIWVEKKWVAIAENPFYSVMNEPNSTLQRLIRKLNLLDVVDEQSSSGKLDIIIQLPYVIKSEARRQQAEQRRQDIEFQLKGSQYGIAYTDGTEKIQQLNRPAENNLLKQIEYLTSLLYSQLGLTPSVMDGTADEKTMLNYMNRTIEPFVTAVTEAMHRSFLTKTARSQGQAIRFFRDPFRLVPIADLAEIVDKFGRNEVASSNEFRQVLGWRPSKDPKADQLINSNMPNPQSVQTQKP